MTKCSEREGKKDSRVEPGYMIIPFEVIDNGDLFYEEVSEVLPLYYMRQSDLYKNNADLLPLRTDGEGAFRGHLMLSPLAAIAYILHSAHL